MGIIEKILKNKRISIWGCGYLGYTSCVKFQADGFFIKLYDFNLDRLEALRKGKYPEDDKIEMWTRSGEIPRLSVEKIQIVSSADDMFDSPVHFISFPAEDNNKQKRLKNLADIFVKNKDRLDRPLIIFQSAGIPRGIENDFIRMLGEKGIFCLYASAFRSDWVIEEFISGNRHQVLAGHDQQALQEVCAFMDLIETRYSTLSTIEEAEVYENAQKVIHYTLSGFLNELSLSYPGIDIRKLSRLLLQNIEAEEIATGLGTFEYKIASSLEHLMDGVKKENYFSVLKSVQRNNVSILFYYCDLLQKKGLKKFCILGLSAKGFFKDVRLSPAVILAEYLHKLGNRVMVHDPLFTAVEAAQILPFADFVDIAKEALNVDAVFVLRKTGMYKSFSQESLEASGIADAKIVIDDTGMFANYYFRPDTLYHIPGDGRLIDLIEL